MSVHLSSLEVHQLESSAKEEETRVKEARTVKKNHEFRWMYRKGKSSVNSYLVLYVRPNRRGHNRLGVTVSTKLGKATVRNRVKRRLREVWRLNDAQMKQGYDMILVARGRSVKSAFSEIEKAYLRAADELKLLEKSL